MAQSNQERTDDPRRVELKKFSFNSKKYDGKGDFEGWVNQLRASLFFLLLTGGVGMYFVNFPERAIMVYPVRVKTLRRLFRQETDMGNALQELAGLRRGKNQTAKKLADSARRLASQAYYSNGYASQEKAALHTIQSEVGEELQLICAERGCKMLKMAVETVEIQERYTKKAVWAARVEANGSSTYTKLMGDKLGALLREMREDRKSSQKKAADMECHSCHQKGHFA